MSIKIITVYEHGTLDFEEQELDDSTQRALEAFNESHKGRNKDGNKYFKCTKMGIKFKSYVGVIQVGEIVVEILPKTDVPIDRENSSFYDEEKHWRRLLLDMISATTEFRLTHPTESNVALHRGHILKCYFEIYIGELQKILHRGLVKRYRVLEENASSLNGKLNFPQHIRKNHLHKERFYTVHDSYDVDHGLHQILYKALKLLKRLNFSSELKQPISSLLLIFPQMRDIKINKQTFSRLRLDRKTAHYRKALKIAEMILLNFHPDILLGKNDVFALLFDMNELWERFVNKILSENLGIENVKANHTFDFVTGDFSSSGRIDTLIHRDGKPYLVLDTKWKMLNGTPSPQDIRQIYAYLRFLGCDRGALVYPGKGKKKVSTYNDSTGEELTCELITIKGTSFDQLKSSLLNIISQSPSF